MLFVMIIAAVLWAIGAIMGVGRRQRWAMIIVLYAVVLILNLALPIGHPVRTATGGNPVFWVLIGGAVAIVMTYRAGIIWLRTRAHSVDQPATKTGFSDTELNRYARHIVLRELGGPGQAKLRTARVLVVGAGGLGSPVLLYLAASGVGTIGVVDDDNVENSNLQRQVIHTDANIGMPKVHSAAAAMRAQNPFVDVRAYERRLEGDFAAKLFDEYDLIIDGTDNFTTRYLVNRIAVELGKPLISGALSQWEGQISVFDPRNGAPCYQCIFPEAPAEGLAPSCSEAGVVGPLPGVIGTMMALEAVKVLTGAGVDLRGEMVIFDGLYGESRKITIKPRENCPICGENAREGAIAQTIARGQKTP